MATEVTFKVEGVSAFGAEGEVYPAGEHTVKASKTLLNLLAAAHADGEAVTVLSGDLPEKAVEPDEVSLEKQANLTDAQREENRRVAEIEVEFSRNFADAKDDDEREAHLRVYSDKLAEVLGV